MALLSLLLVALVGSLSGEPVYLPYSETEDVDFTLESPDHVGCYR
jgi:hypothetical protein